MWWRTGNIQSKRGNLVLIALAGLAACWWLPEVARGQLREKAVPVQVLEAQVEGEDEEAAKPPGLEGSGDYQGGASLKTDPDLMTRLDKAEQYRKDGNFRVAARLWQSVLDDSGDTLYTDDGETYYALARRIEDLIAGLDSEGLAAYRIAADADAAGILAGARSEYDQEALGRVVRSYFLSSLGDDAAFRLGCIYLDRYDFTGAIRLFRKVAEQYPDPSIPLDQVWLRIAITYAWTGDSDSARAALQRAEELGADTTDRLYESVNEIITGAPAVDVGGTATAWRGRLGGGNRINVMPTIADPPSSRLRAGWQFHFEPRDHYFEIEQIGDSLLMNDGQQEIALQSDEKKLVDAWRKANWRPAGGLLFDQQRVVWKTGADLVAFRRDVMESPSPAWRSMWLNEFRIDDATSTWRQMLDMYGRYGESVSTGSSPARPVEIQLFGDRIAQAMSIHEGVVYSIEGKEYAPWDRRTASQPNNRGFNWGTVPRRTRTNHLVAYDLQSGMFLWRLPPAPLPGKSTVSDSATETVQPDQSSSDGPSTPLGSAVEGGNPFEDVGFMAAPVGYGELLIAPVNLGGSIWLYAMHSRRQGELVWRSYLCDEPSGGSQPWSPIQLTLGGSTVYAVCGTGVVFSVDAMTGVIRFARRYQRTGEPSNLMQRFGNQMELLELDGWQEDIAIPAGNTLVVFASDYNAIFGINPDNANFIWRVDNRPFGKKFDYLIGIHGDLVYVGASDAIAAFSLKAQGRWEWVWSIPERSYGQAMLTGDALYVPVGSSIVKLGLQGRSGDGDVLATFPVDLGVRAPVGNLYSDGRYFWVVAANRLFALTDDAQGTAEEQGDGGDAESAQQDAQPVTVSGSALTESGEVFSPAGERRRN